MAWFMLLSVLVILYWYMYCYISSFKDFPLCKWKFRNVLIGSNFILFFCTINDITTHMETSSNTKSSSILNPSEGNNDLFITGYNSLLANDDTRAARDFYLLLMVYVNYFCVPVLSFVLNGLYRFGKGVQSKFSERSNLVCMAIGFFVEEKEYVSLLPFLQTEQVGSNCLSRSLYRKTVLL